MMGSKYIKETDILGFGNSVQWEWGMGLGHWINDSHQNREYGRKSIWDISQIPFIQHIKNKIHLYVSHKPTLPFYISVTPFFYSFSPLTAWLLVHMLQ